MIQLKLTPQETESFTYLAKSESGETFKNFLKRLTASLGDITTLTGTDISKEVQTRKDVIQIINSNILDRFKVLSGEVAPPQIENEFK